MKIIDKIYNLPSNDFVEAWPLGLFLEFLSADFKAATVKFCGGSPDLRFFFFVLLFVFSVLFPARVDRVGVAITGSSGVGGVASFDSSSMGVACPEAFLEEIWLFP